MLFFSSKTNNSQKCGFPARGDCALNSAVYSIKKLCFIKRIG